MWFCWIYITPRMVLLLRTRSCLNLVSGEARQETLSGTITMARFWMERYLIPGNQTIQLYRFHFRFDYSLMSIICSNTVLCFFFIFENFERTWHLFKRLIANFSIWEGKELFCTLGLSQTPSRGSDPPSEAKCFRHTSLKILSPIVTCQIGNTTEERENRYVIPFYVLRIVWG